ncbi:MAG: hypothetical protein RL660_2905 [Bacteroidota bacterium]|jgi:hypothetical protein
MLRQFFIALGLIATFCGRANAQSVITAFEQGSLVASETSLYNPRTFAVDKNNTKYILCYFLDTLRAGNIVLTAKQAWNPSVGNCMAVVCVDSVGNVLWASKVVEGDSLIAGPNKIILLHNRLFLTCPNFYSKVYCGSDSFQSHGQTDGLIVCLSTEGTMLNKIQFGGTSGESIEDLEFDGSTLVLAASYNVVVQGVGGNANYIAKIGVDTLHSNNTATALIGLDTNLMLQFSIVYDDTVVPRIADVCITDDYYYCLVGTTSRTNQKIGGLIINFPLSAYSYFPSLLRLAKDGSTASNWYRKMYNTAGMNSLRTQCLVVQDNKVYLAGYSFCNTPNQFVFDGSNTTFTGLGDVDFFVTCYDTLGNFKWAKVSKSYGGEDIRSMAVDDSNNIVFAGVYSNADLVINNDTLEPRGGYDGFAWCLDSNGNTVWNGACGGFNLDMISQIANVNNNLYVLGATGSVGGCNMGIDSLFPPSIKGYSFVALIDTAIAPVVNTSIQNIQEPALQIWPNPVQSVLHFAQAGQAKRYRFKIVNTLGAVAQQGELCTNASIDVSALHSGTYLLISEDANGMVGRKIFIKE